VLKGNASAPAGAGFIPALDGIRGVAILWVVLHNATDVTMAPATGVLHAANLLTHPGWIGVQLFFALSGFLITGGLLDSQQSASYFRNFYARRALRILPLYYTVLLVLLVLLPRVPALASSIETQGQASLWLFTVNWIHVAPYGFAHFWSLAVEEQFYLLWPLVVWKLSPRRLLDVCVGVAVAALVLRGVLLACGADWGTLYTNTGCHMDALALGGAGACLARLPALRARLATRARRVVSGAALLFVAAIPLTYAYDRTRWPGETLGYSILAFTGSVLVTALAVAPAQLPRLTAFLSVSTLRSLGKYSYAIYVFHGLLNKLVGGRWLSARYGPALPAGPVLAYAFLLLLVSYGLAYCSYWVLEEPFLRLKRFFAPGESRVRAPGSA